MSGFTPDLMTSADDVFWFPNMVGPVYPGSALLFRVRPNGQRSELGRSRTARRVLVWHDPGSAWQMPERRFYADWHERKWGEITEQDYTNLANVWRTASTRAASRAASRGEQESNACCITARVVDLSDRVNTNALSSEWSAGR